MAHCMTHYSLILGFVIVELRAEDGPLGAWSSTAGVFVMEPVEFSSCVDPTGMVQPSLCFRGPAPGLVSFAELLGGRVLRTRMDFARCWTAETKRRDPMI